jgi:DNA-binding IclR family transcriptional regulator
MSQQRTDNDYVIDALLKGLQVLEGLEGDHFEPVKLRRLQERTRLPYDTCMRAMKTLKVAGLAVETDRGWRLSARFIAFCRRAAEAQIEV